MSDQETPRSRRGRRTSMSDLDPHQTPTFPRPETDEERAERLEREATAAAEDTEAAGLMNTPRTEHARQKVTIRTPPRSGATSTAGSEDLDPDAVVTSQAIDPANRPGAYLPGANRNEETVTTITTDRVRSTESPSLGARRKDPARPNVDLKQFMQGQVARARQEEAQRLLTKPKSTFDSDLLDFTNQPPPLNAAGKKPMSLYPSVQQPASNPYKPYHFNPHVHDDDLADVYAMDEGGIGYNAYQPFSSTTSASAFGKPQHTRFGQLSAKNIEDDTEIARLRRIISDEASSHRGVVHVLASDKAELESRIARDQRQCDRLQEDLNRSIRGRKQDKENRERERDADYRRKDRVRSRSRKRSVSPDRPKSPDMDETIARRLVSQAFDATAHTGLLGEVARLPRDEEGVEDMLNMNFSMIRYLWERENLSPEDRREGAVKFDKWFRSNDKETIRLKLMQRDARVSLEAQKAVALSNAEPVTATPGFVLKTCPMVGSHNLDGKIKKEFDNLFRDQTFHGDEKDKHTQHDQLVDIVFEHVEEHQLSRKAAYQLIRPVLKGSALKMLISYERIGHSFEHFMILLQGMFKKHYNQTDLRVELNELKMKPPLNMLGHLAQISSLNQRLHSHLEKELKNTTTSAAIRADVLDLLRTFYPYLVEGLVMKDATTKAAWAQERRALEAAGAPMSEAKAHWHPTSTLFTYVLDATQGLPPGTMIPRRASTAQAAKSAEDPKPKGKVAAIAAISTCEGSDEEEEEVTEDEYVVFEEGPGQEYEYFEEVAVEEQEEVDPALQAKQPVAAQVAAFRTEQRTPPNNFRARPDARPATGQAARRPPPPPPGTRPPGPPTCRTCGGVGHFERVCPNNRKD